MPIFRILRFLVFLGYAFGKLEAYPTTNSAASRYSGERGAKANAEVVRSNEEADAAAASVS